MVEGNNPGAGVKQHPRFFWSGQRVPAQPGYFLETRYLHPAGISQGQLAKSLGISRRRVNELVCGKRAITPDTAVRLAKFFGTDVAFWLQLQFQWDVYQARKIFIAQPTNLP